MGRSEACTFTFPVHDFVLSSLVATKVKTRRTEAIEDGVEAYVVGVGRRGSKVAEGPMAGDSRDKMLS